MTTTTKNALKTLKFTPENFKRHVTRVDKSYNYMRKVIYTTRAEMKGRLGDVFDLGCGVFVLDKILPYDYNERDLLVSEHFTNEGFTSSGMFARELETLYPEAKKLYVHVFKELFAEIPFPLCYRCENMLANQFYPAANGDCTRICVACRVFGIQDLVSECKRFKPRAGA